MCLSRLSVILFMGVCQTFPVWKPPSRHPNPPRQIPPWAHLPPTSRWPLQRTVPIQSCVFYYFSISNRKKSFLNELGVHLREMYSTQSFSDVVNSVKQSMTASVEITPEVSATFVLLAKRVVEM